MGKQPEALFKEQVLADLAVDYPDAYILKTQERGRHGVPDLLCCINGKFVAIELKTDTGKLAKVQAHTLKRILAAKGISFEACPSEWSMLRGWLRMAVHGR